MKREEGWMFVYMYVCIYIYMHVFMYVYMYYVCTVYVLVGQQKFVLLFIQCLWRTFQRHWGKFRGGWRWLVGNVVSSGVAYITFNDCKRSECSPTNISLGLGFC